MDFKLSTSPIDRDRLLISVEGELDLSTADQVERSAGQAISARCPLLLDLSGCSFIDSTGLRPVLKIREALAKAAGPDAPMAVVASSEIRKFFSITAIDQSVHVFTTRDEALASLRARMSTPRNGESASPPDDHLARSAEG
ncbi:MAG: STAS domain-containing protein [Actinomycetota bacterium]